MVVYNLTRFAREKYDHFALRAHLKSLGISLRSATEPIDDTSTGKLMEGVLASFAQFDNDVRSERTRAGMRAALELGRWTFPAPLGYPNAPKWSSASLVHDPARAALVTQVFEDYASGRFTKQEVLARATEGGLRTRRGLVLSPQSFGQMLKCTLYIGVINSPQYGVSTRGTFEPLVSQQTSTVPKPLPKAACNGRLHASGIIQISRCVVSFTATRAVGRSREVGRKAGTTTTRTTTASGSAVP